MDFSLLRRKVTLERKGAGADDGMGGKTGTGYSPVMIDGVAKTMRVKIEPLRGEEAVAGMQEEHRMTHKITARYGHDVRPETDRFVRGSTVYKIVAPPRNIDEANRFVEYMCESGLAT